MFCLGYPEPLRSRVLKGLPKIEGRPGASMSPMDLDKLKADLIEAHGNEVSPIWRLIDLLNLLPCVNLSLDPRYGRDVGRHVPGRM
jgi:pyruvate carboxylase